MRTFTQKQNRPEQKSLANLERSNASTPAATHEAHPLLHWQRTIGNQAVLRLLQARADGLEAASPTQDGPTSEGRSETPITIQPKLSVNTPGDIYEQEADHLAEQVMRTQAPELQRACLCGGGCSKCQTDQPSQERQRLQTKHVGSSDSGMSAAPPIVHEALASPGQPLDTATRNFMEPRFGHDFSDVRVHGDGKAMESAQAVRARAYTVGHDIIFGPGQYSPTAPDGKKLIAHELAHVVQSGGDAPVLRRDLDDDADEIEMPAEYVGKGSLCAGRPCITDDVIYADVNKSHAEDVAAEERATAERKRRRRIKQGYGSKQQKWEIEFQEDSRITKNIGAVPATRDDGTLTPSGVRVPSYVGDYLSPRPFYERRDAAMLAYQGFIHYAEIVEAGQAQAALHIALALTGGAPVPDNYINLQGFARWTQLAAGARDNALLLAMIASGGAAGDAAAAKAALLRAEGAFAKQIGDLIGKSAQGVTMTVEGVGVSGIRATVQNGELVASYETIVNIDRIAGQGKRIQSAFEAGAVQAARTAGLKSARVGVETVTNPAWREYLLSIGYNAEMMELRKGVFSQVFTKFFAL